MHTHFRFKAVKSLREPRAFIPFRHRLAAHGCVRSPAILSGRRAGIRMGQTNLAAATAAGNQRRFLTDGTASGFVTVSRSKSFFATRRASAWTVVERS
jgi:hypothetical protein